MKQFNIDAASQDDTLTRTNNAAATTTTTNNIIISSSVPSSRRLPTNRSFNEPPAPILIQGSPKHSFYYDFPPPPLQTTTSSSFSLNFLQHQDELQQHNQQQQKQPLTPVSPTSPNTAAMLPLLPRPALMENPNVQYQQQLPLSSSPGSHSIASSTASGETLHNYNNTLMMMSASPPQNLVLFGDYSSQLHALHHHGQQQLYKYDDVKDTKATAAIATINSDDIILNLDHNILRDIDSSASNSSNPETDQSNTPFSSSLPSSSKLETLISWIGFPLVGFG